MLANLVPFLVIGAVTGAVYGLAATGLVLTYKTSGIFNFGHGAIAAAAAYLFYWLNVENNVPWVLSAVISVLVLGLVMGWLLELFSRRLAKQTTAMKVVGTIGVILAVQGVTVARFGTDALRLPQFLPNADKLVPLGGANVTVGQITVVAISLVAVVGLYLFFRFTPLGLHMRAVVDDPELVGLHSVSAIRTRRLSWFIGATFAALSGVLLAPTIGVQATTLVYLVVQAFGAAAVGAFRNIPLTYLGGLVIGVLSSVATHYATSFPLLSGLPSGLPFIVFLIALLVLPKRYLVSRVTAVVTPPPVWRAPARLQLVGAVVVLVIMALVPMFAPDQLSYYTIGVSQAVVLLSLGLVVRTAGMVSLSHAAFAAIGAVAFAQLASASGMPWLVAVIVGALIVAPFAAILALVAARLSGIFLALATFGFGLFVQQMFYRESFMFTSLSQGRTMPRPGFAEDDVPFYYLACAFLIVVALVIVLIHASRLGRMLRGISESPLAVGTAGLSVNVTRVLVFTISGAIAGLGGILYGQAANFATLGDPRYDSLQSLLLVATLAVLPFREPWFAVVGALAAVIPGYIPGDSTVAWLNVLFGVAAIVIACQLNPPGVPAGVRAVLERIFGSHRTRTLMSPEEAAKLTRSGQTRPDPDLALVVDEIVVRFGGHTAVDKVSLTAPVGKITGLIGPNGAGKTTLFNACGGLLRPAGGRVAFGNHELTHLPAARRAARGLGRTFQLVQLCESLTVEENVALGREAALAGRNPISQCFATRQQRRLVQAATVDAMALVGILDIRHEQAGRLSTGQRRLVELARCLAGQYDLVLLDEPSSGLDRAETAAFADLLTRVVRERGCGVLIVEHDMSLVLGISDQIYVVDFGELLAHGDSGTIASSDVVKAAYFGNDDPVIAAAVAR